MPAIKKRYRLGMAVVRSVDVVVNATDPVRAKQIALRDLRAKYPNLTVYCMWIENKRGDSIAKELTREGHKHVG